MQNPIKSRRQSVSTHGQIRYTRAPYCASPNPWRIFDTCTALQWRPLKRPRATAAGIAVPGDPAFDRIIEPAPRDLVVHPLRYTRLEMLGVSFGGNTDMQCDK
jgi:hypothetical protein